MSRITECDQEIAINRKEDKFGFKIAHLSEQLEN